MNKASPGLKKLNSAGTAINKENSGINIHVLFKKKHILTLEEYARTRHTTYKQSETTMLFEKRIAKITMRNVITLILGSNDCKKSEKAKKTFDFMLWRFR